MGEAYDRFVEALQSRPDAVVISAADTAWMVLLGVHGHVYLKRALIGSKATGPPPNIRALAAFRSASGARQGLPRGPGEARMAGH
jgi:hypothetical protein